jgi:hypothetical protein
MSQGIFCEAYVQNLLIIAMTWFAWGGSRRRACSGYRRVGGVRVAPKSIALLALMENRSSPTDGERAEDGGKCWLPATSSR